MNRSLYLAAFLLGLACVAWIGVGYAGGHPLALTMTALIGAFYLMGAFELRRFHQATRGLSQALAAVPEPLDSLTPWLASVPASLQNVVRQRVEGERVALPGPVMTPYLVGLLVLLGMLGTFLGMVVTLNGAVLALESTTDLQAVRESLAAPVKGLGLAFGTSVAGVAASAMLGLMSALCRSARLQAGQALDQAVATRLRVFSRAHQREESFKTLQAQALAMPAVVSQLQDMMQQMERQGLALNERLLAGQLSFHQQTEAVYSSLAASVDRSLRESVAESARAAGAAIQPLVAATMSGMADATASLHAQVAGTVQQQLDGVSERFGASVSGVSAHWNEALAQHQRVSEQLAGDTQRSLARFTESFEQRATTLLDGVARAHGELQRQLAAQDQQRLAGWQASLEATARSLQQAWQQAATEGLAQQSEICQTLARTADEITAQAETHARQTLAEIQQLMQATAQAPRAAAELMGELRHSLSDSMARDNSLLEERGRIMASLGTLLEGVQQAATHQRGAVDALVASSETLLARASSRFQEQVEAETDRISGIAAQITGSAVEVASLGEAFGQAVGQFSDSNQQLMLHLQRIEASLDKSLLRSDEQLAYYVAQAREIIDLSLMSQKQIVDDMQRLASRPAQLLDEAA